MYSSRLDFAFESPLRLKVAVAGCGGQAFRNILPAFQYAPVELVATCDIDVGRARAYAQQFGAARGYDDLGVMLESEALDAVFLATGYDENSLPRYPDQAILAMEAGVHAWIEKPPAGSSAEIRRMREVSLRTGRQVGIGFMKMFSPGVSKIHDIMRRPEFGRPTTFYLRDPEGLPPLEQRGDPAAMRWFLDHIVHPASIIQRLMGPVHRLYLEEGPGGEPIFSMKFESGAAGVLHMPWGISGNSPMERLEVVGQGANVVLDNNIRLTYYRPGHRGTGDYEYGRIPDYTSPLEQAPLRWEMDGYSGQPYNMHLFYQGYAQEILYFTTSLLKGEPITIGGLDDAWHILRFYEACANAPGQVIEMGQAVG